MQVTAAAMQTRRLFGLEFADFDVAASAAWIDARPGGAAFGYVVTPNADHLVRLSRNPGLQPLYDGALLCLMDSRVVARGAGLLGLTTPAVTTGSDLTAALLAQHLRPQERVTIIGVREQHMAELVRRTGIAPPAHYDPPMGFDRDPVEMARAVRFVLDHPARYVFLAVGSPRQEQLAAAIVATGAATGTGLCIGASLEFLAGAVPRAPGFMQKAGIEWLHRLMADPKRLSRRYLVDNPVIFRLLWEERRRQRAG
jgi:N-acetylglucosaminyldiphosphoundecaprenol N-acetyl-beta-D-mannosaminyltransferase